MEVLNVITLAFSPSNPAKANIAGNSLIEISKTSFVNQNRPQRRCEEGKNLHGYGQCIRHNLQEYMIDKKGLKCAPPHLIQIMNMFNGTICKTSNETQKGIEILTSEMGLLPLQESHIKPCLFPCLTDSYSVTALDFEYAQMPDDKWWLFVRFSNGYVETVSEYFIYEFLDIITATGSALGMFLGWSLFQQYEDIWKFISKIFSGMKIPKNVGNK